MIKGYYGGGTFGWRTPFGGVGAGLYFDNHGNLYPQFYYGMPRAGVSAGYSPDLEGLLTGSSASGSFGRGPMRPNMGASDGSIGIGIGTPGFGASYGFGPYTPQQLAALLIRYGLVTPAMGPQDELSPFERSLQSKSGSIGAKAAPAAPFLQPREQNPLGAGMGDWSASVTRPNVVGAGAPGGSLTPNQVVNDRFGSWGSSANVVPPNAPGSSESFSDRFGKWSSAPADNFDNPRSPVLRAPEVSEIGGSGSAEPADFRSDSVVACDARKSDRA